MSSMAGMRHDRGAARQQTPVEALNNKGAVTPTSKSKSAASKAKKYQAADAQSPSFGRAAYVNLQGQNATIERSLKAIRALQATYAQAQVARAQQGLAETEPPAFAPRNPGLQVTYASLAAGAYAQMAATTAPSPSSPTEPVSTEPVVSEPIPTEPTPTEPTPQPTPIEPAPTEPAPTEPTDPITELLRGNNGGKKK